MENVNVRRVTLIQTRIFAIVFSFYNNLECDVNCKECVDFSNKCISCYYEQMQIDSYNKCTC